MENMKTQRKSPLERRRLAQRDNIKKVLRETGFERV
jgi:hypothetical protein